MKDCEVGMQIDLSVRWTRRQQRLFKGDDLAVIDVIVEVQVVPPKSLIRSPRYSQRRFRPASHFTSHDGEEVAFSHPVLRQRAQTQAQIEQEA